jgi:ABC-type Mn2+/Zn2+ transport system ATPase subunit
MDARSARWARRGFGGRNPVTAIALTEVTIAFNGRRILSAVSFTIEDGEFVAMLGANGSSKTTLMRAVLGLVPVRSGTIEVLGRPASRGNAQIGYMPQLRGVRPGPVHRTRLCCECGRWPPLGAATP